MEADSLVALLNERCIAPSVDSIGGRAYELIFVISVILALHVPQERALADQADLHSIQLKLLDHFTE